MNVTGGVISGGMGITETDHLILSLGRHVAADGLALQKVEMAASVDGDEQPIVGDIDERLNTHDQPDSDMKIEPDSDEPEEPDLYEPEYVHQSGDEPEELGNGQSSEEADTTVGVRTENAIVRRRRKLSRRRMKSLNMLEESSNVSSQILVALNQIVENQAEQNALLKKIIEKLDK